MLLDLRSLEEVSQVTYSYTGSGGIVFAGHANETFTFAYAADGGIVFSGHAAEAAVFAYAGSGGIVFGGQARRATTNKYTVVDGGVVFGGTDSEETTNVYTADGGIVFSGAAGVVFTPATSFTYIYAGSGGILFGGQAASSGPAEVFDSRGWFELRRHARVSSLDPAPYSVVASGVAHQVRADAAVPIVGSRVPIASGSVSVYTDVSIAAKPYTDGVAVRVVAGTVSILADARVEMVSGGVAISTAAVSAVASTVIPIRGQSIRTSVGRVSVEIGPDLVQAEEDEFIFLLEVA